MIITASIQSSLAAPEQTVLHVGVGAEAEEFDLAGLLHLRGPILEGRGHFIDVGEGVDKEQIHIVRLQPFQTLIQALGEVAALGLELGDQEDLLAGLGVAGEEAADALLAQAVSP